MLLDPKEIVVPIQDGEERVYIISRFPAMAGREIFKRYMASAIPKVGDYAVNEAMMFKIMSYVGVQVPGRETPLLLTSRALVDNHVPDWETLARLEEAMLSYNCSSFGKGASPVFSGMLHATALPKLAGILAGLMGGLAKTAEPPTTH